MITHLEAAHSAYSNTLSEYHGTFNTKLGWQIKFVAKLLHKNTHVCSLMALCYASFGERQAALNSINLVRKEYLGISGDFGLVKKVVYFWSQTLNPINHFVTERKMAREMLAEADFLQKLQDTLEQAMD